MQTQLQIFVVAKVTIAKSVANYNRCKLYVDAKNIRCKIMGKHLGSKKSMHFQRIIFRCKTIAKVFCLLQFGCKLNLHGAFCNSWNCLLQQLEFIGFPLQLGFCNGFASYLDGCIRPFLLQCSKMYTVTYQHYVESVIVDKVKMLYGVGCGGNGNKGSD